MKPRASRVVQRHGLVGRAGVPASRLEDSIISVDLFCISFPVADWTFPRSLIINVQLAIVDLVKSYEGWSDLISSLN